MFRLRFNWAQIERIHFSQNCNGEIQAKDRLTVRDTEAVDIERTTPIDDKW